MVQGPFSVNPVSAISHKLRTPLTVIMSTVNNFLDGAFGALSEEQTKWLKKLETHTKTLEELINEMVEIMKKQPDRTETIERAMNEGRAEPKTVHPFPISPAKPHETPVFPAGRVPTILVVDDEPDIREVIEEGLSTQGFKIFTASNREEALEAALAQKPDLVLMDVLLKHQNGMQVCREIKAQLSVFTPVILVTGQDDLRQKIAGAEHEADDLLTKPFQMEELFARVTSMLRMKNLHDELVRAQSELQRKAS